MVLWCCMGFKHQLTHIMMMQGSGQLRIELTPLGINQIPFGKNKFFFFWNRSNHRIIIMNLMNCTWNMRWNFMDWYILITVATETNHNIIRNGPIWQYAHVHKWAFNIWKAGDALSLMTTSQNMSFDINCLEKLDHADGESNVNDQPQLESMYQGKDTDWMTVEEWRLTHWMWYHQRDDHGWNGWE